MEAAHDGIELGVVLNVKVVKDLEVTVTVTSDEVDEHLRAINEDEEETADNGGGDVANEKGKGVDAHPDNTLGEGVDIGVHAGEQGCNKEDSEKPDRKGPGVGVVHLEALVAALSEGETSRNVTNHLDFS